MKIEPRQYSDGKWLVDLRAHGQGRHFFKTEGEAGAFSDANQNLVNEFGRNAIASLSPERIAAMISAEMRLRACGLTLDQAISIAIEHRPNVIGKDLKSVCEVCIEAKKNSGKREEYIRVLSIHLASLRKRFKDETEAHTVSGIQIEEWLNEKQPSGKHWSQATKKSVFTDVQTLFAFAIKRGWCKTNPCESVEEIKLDNKPPEIFTVEECWTFMNAVRDTKPELASYFALQLFGGLRASEAQRASADSIKETVVEVTAIMSKTRQRRLVTINPTLKRWLKFKSGSQQFREPTDAEWRDLKSAAKIKWKKNGLRHSFVSYSVPIFGIQRTAMEAGHSEQMLFKHYRELVTPTESKRFWNITPTPS